MSDKEFGGNDDLSLPKATVQKIINEVLSSNPSLAGPDGQPGGMTFAKETRDVLIDCCVEFITMLSSEANEIAEKDAKKTIACEHVTKALTELGFDEYVPELRKQADSFKNAAANREKKQTKIEQSGMTSEELIRAQEELFKTAGDKYNATTERAATKDQDASHGNSESEHEFAEGLFGHDDRKNDSGRAYGDSNSGRNDDVEVPRHNSPADSEHDNSEDESDNDRDEEEYDHDSSDEHSEEETADEEDVDVAGEDSKPDDPTRRPDTPQNNPSEPPQIGPAHFNPPRKHRLILHGPRKPSLANKKGRPKSPIKQSKLWITDRKPGEPPRRRGRPKGHTALPGGIKAKEADAFLAHFALSETDWDPSTSDDEDEGREEAWGSTAAFE